MQTARQTTRRQAAPKFNRCDFCGKRAHKVVTVAPDGTASGYCPKCWDDDSRFGAPAQAARRGEVVTVDNRNR